MFVRNTETHGRQRKAKKQKRIGKNPTKIEKIDDQNGIYFNVSFFFFLLLSSPCKHSSS